MSIATEILIIGGMDLDSNRNLIKNGDYRSARNIARPIGNNGVKENQKSSLEIPYNLPDGDNITFKSVVDSNSGNTIYLIYNSLGNHSILEFNPNTLTIEPILEPKPSINFTTNFLAFNENFRIHSVDVIDGNILYTDNNEEPRHINIDSAKAFMQQRVPQRNLFPYDNILIHGTDLDKKRVIFAIKTPPLDKPLCAYSNDTNIGTNNLKGRLFQFRYRYVYFDNSKTTFSPVSYLVLPTNIDEVANGLDINKFQDNNIINVVLNTGNSNVVRIEIAVRVGNTGQWSLIAETVDKYNQDNQRILNDYENTTYVFDGKTNTIPLADIEVALNFHSIPAKAEAQKVLHNNTYVYGNYLQGYDNTNIDVSMDYTFVEQEFNRACLRMRDYSYAYPIWWIQINQATNPSGHYQINVPTPTEFEVGAIINIIIQTDTVTTFDSPNLRTISVNYTVVLSDLVSAAALTTSLNNAITTSQYRYDGNGVVMFDSIILGSININVQELGIYKAKIYDLQASNPTKKVSSWKKGCTHRFAIEYMDNVGRIDTVNISDASQIYVPTNVEEVPLSSIFKQEWSVELQMTINNIAPEWATKYKILWGGRSIGRSDYFMMSGNPQPYKNESGAYETTKVEVPISQTFNYLTSDKTPGFEYQYQEGDRLRVLSRSNDVVSNVVEDVKVYGYDTAKKALISDTFDIVNFLGRAGIIIEVYNDNKQESIIYHEIGEEYEIVDRKHKGNVQDQTIAQPAIIELTHGDCYLMNRCYNIFENNFSINTQDIGVVGGELVNPFDTIVESDNYSDFYVSKSTNIGRVNLYDRYAKQQRYINRIIHGGQYRTGGAINSLFNFDPSNITEVDISFGAITKLEQVGYALKVLQERKQSSIYIQRKYFSQQGNSSSLVLSDEYFADFYPSPDPYGCINPESVEVRGRNMYYYDANNGKIIRDSANGPLPISDYNFNSFVYDFSIANRNIKQTALIGYDESKNTIYISLKGQLGSDVIAFYETTNEAISFHDMDVDSFGNALNAMLAFRNGTLYQVERGVGYLNILGEDVEASIDVICNTENKLIKLFDNIALYSNVVWNSKEIGDINIEPSPRYPLGMLSRLKEGKYRAKEGVFYASFIRDAKTPNFVDEEVALVSGRRLEGPSMEIKLRTTSNERAELRGCLLYVTPIANKTT
jgi:hypothetical protein